MSSLINIEMLSKTKQQPSIEMVLDQMDALVYVTDIKTFKVLYLNKIAENIYGKAVDETCWNFLQKKQTKKCPFCIIEKLSKENLKTNIFTQDIFNEFDNKWYEKHEKIIKWSDNKDVKLTILYNVTKRKEEEKQLYILFKQQELFSKIATTFNRKETFANKVNEVIKLLGKFVDASRVSIYENFDNNNTTRITYEWCNKKIKPKINKLTPISFDSHNPLIAETFKNKILKVTDLGKEKYKKLNLLIEFDVKSMLLVPIYLRNKHVGFVSLEQCNKKREWLNNEIVLLKTFGNIISTTFERKTFEEKRLRYELKLKEANATKDRFFSIIARDLQAPFSTLAGLSSILVDSYDLWTDEKRKEFIKSISESSNTGIRLLDNLLVWSKIQSGNIEFRPETVDIRSIISQTVEQLQNKANKKNIVIEGIPKKQFFVYADYLMLNTITKNILNNAIKFTKPNGIINIDVSEEEEFTEISITDNGIGIEKEHLSKLFRIDTDNLTYGPIEEKGTGLGLIISKEFIKKNKGKIKVQSELEKGSTFKFSIPRKR